MDLKNSGLLFVLVVILEALNGLALNNIASAKISTQDLPALHSVAEKSQTENGSTTETVKIIIPNTSEIIPKSNLTSNIISKTNTSTTAIIRTETTAPKTNIFPMYTNTSSVPTPEKGTWIIKNETTNMTCIIVEMALQLNVTYPGKKENTIINIPKNSSAEGVCSNSSQSITLKWGANHTLQINFNANKTTNNFFIAEFLISLKAVVFNATDNSALTFKNDSMEFVTPLEMSYKCNRVQYLNLESENKKLKAVLSLSQTQFEAFMNKSKVEFGAAQDCDTFDTPDVVPIAVGCALAVLVLVVLVAYLIGRKRSQNRGYLSM